MSSINYLISFFASMFLCKFIFVFGKYSFCIRYVCRFVLKHIHRATEYMRYGEDTETNSKIHTQEFIIMGSV